MYSLDFSSKNLFCHVKYRLGKRLILLFFFFFSRFLQVLSAEHVSLCLYWLLRDFLVTWLAGWTDGRAYGWVGGQTGGRTDRQIEAGRLTGRHR